MEEKSETRLAAARSAIEALPEFDLYGRVAAVRGLLIEIAGRFPPCMWAGGSRSKPGAAPSSLAR